MIQGKIRMLPSVIHDSYQSSNLSDAQRQRDDGRPWGFVIGSDFIRIPKLPCLLAGYGPAPFPVVMPSGDTRFIEGWPVADAAE